MKGMKKLISRRYVVEQFCSSIFSAQRFLTSPNHLLVLIALPSLNDPQQAHALLEFLRDQRIRRHNDVQLIIITMDLPSTWRAFFAEWRSMRTAWSRVHFLSDHRFGEFGPLCVLDFHQAASGTQYSLLTQQRDLTPSILLISPDGLIVYSSFFTPTAHQTIFFMIGLLRERAAGRFAKSPEILPSSPMLPRPHLRHSFCDRLARSLLTVSICPFSRCRTCSTDAGISAIT